MIKALLLTTSKESWADFSATLEQYDKIELLLVASGAEAFKILENQDIHLIITDENLNDMSGLDFVRKLVAVNPIINCAAASSLSADDFHEASEGLGIFMQLPPCPGRQDASALLLRLNKILHLL